jgi:predicted TIM-barrel fold metal-dependent hydrolase
MDYKIIDADRHVTEPVNMWEAYVDNEIFTNYPIGLKQQFADKEKTIALPPVYTIGGEPVLFSWLHSHQLASMEKSPQAHNSLLEGMAPDRQLESMERHKIAKAFLFPTFATFLINHQDLPSKVSGAYALAYNNWLKDYCDYNEHRLKGVGLISRHDTSSMLEQLQTVIDFGWTCITLRPEMIMGKTLGHCDHDLFWQQCEKYNIAVAIHGGTHVHVPTAGSERFTSHFALHACSHPIEAQMAFLSLLESGVFERYPKLKFAFLEAGSAWVPYWLCRLNIKMLPSNYFKRQCWVAVEPGEPNLRETIKWIGHKKLLFGSDFPHPDHAHIDVENIASDCSELTSAELHDMLDNNANDFFERKLSLTNIQQEAIYDSVKIA